jgi:phospholipid/cholesterol/gamma-HCH transport system substrate-binding protein
MPRQLHWRELVPGIIAAAAIAAVVIVTLVFARVGQIHGKKVTLYVVAEDAEGILPGTEVWLAGQKQGLVTDVAFRPPSTDTLERLLITTELLEEVLHLVRRDSYASLKPGGSVIGTLVVSISPGSASSPPLHEGDTLRVRKKGLLTNLATNVGTIEPAFSALASEVNTLTTKMASPVGTVGNVRVHGMPRMPEVSARMSRLAARAGGNGTIGLAMRGNLTGRSSRAMAAADSIRTLMSSNRTTLGRFRRDSTLVTKAGHVLAELDTLRALVSGPIGGAAAADSTLARELSRTRVLLAALIKDIKSKPGRYINF